MNTIRGFEYNPILKSHRLCHARVSPSSLGEDRHRLNCSLNDILLCSYGKTPNFVSNVRCAMGRTDGSHGTGHAWPAQHQICCVGIYVSAKGINGELITTVPRHPGSGRPEDGPHSINLAG